MVYQVSSKKLVIAYLIDSITSPDGLIGGTERQLLQILKHTDKTKFDPILITLRNYEPFTASIGTEAVTYNLNVTSLLSFHSLYKWVGFIFFLIRNKVDIIHTFFFDSTLFGITAATIARVRAIIPFRRDMGFWMTPRLRFFQKLLNCLSTSIFVNSSAIKHAMIATEKVASRKLSILYNGIDLREIENAPPADLFSEIPTLKKSDKIVGLVANFNRHVKRVDIAIKAMLLVKEWSEDVKLLIIGGGELKTKLQLLATRKNISDQVIFAGKKPSAIPYIKNFDIGLMTSDSEGLSNVLMEYMACGIPVVSTDVGGNPELIEHNVNGLLAAKGDYHQIAENLITLLANPDLRKKMGNKGVEKIKQSFTWGQVLLDMESKYERIS